MENLILPGKLFSDATIGIVGVHDFHRIHHFTFRNKPLSNTTCANNANTDIFLHFFAQHRRRYSLGPRQIHHLAIFVQVVEFSFPVGTNSKYIHIIFLDIIYFLSEVVFDDYFICQPCCFYRFHAFKHVVSHIQLSTVAVEVIIGNTYNKIVSQSLSPFQQVYMSLVEQVVCAVSDNFFHIKLFNQKEKILL